MENGGGVGGFPFWPASPGAAPKERERERERESKGKRTASTG